VAEPGEDEIFSDEITVPAWDGYPLAATLYLPRGAKRHAVLINSAQRSNPERRKWLTWIASLRSQ
jgi:predicted acyl esterase